MFTIGTRDRVGAKSVKGWTLEVMKKVQRRSIVREEEKTSVTAKKRSLERGRWGLASAGRSVFGGDMYWRSTGTLRKKISEKGRKRLA